MPTYIADGLKELLQDMLQRNKETFEEIANTTEITSNFIQGKQLWRQNHWNNTWTIQKTALADTNRISSINIMQFYCTSQMKMMTASNPDLEPAEEYKQSKYKEQVKIAKAVWNKYERKFYTPWINNQEALHAITSGTYIESVSYDHLKESATVFQEVFGEKEIQLSEGYSKCFACNHDGAYSQFVPEEESIPSCPECGSTEILPPESPVTQRFNSVVGVQPIKAGDLVLRLLPIQTVRFDITKRVEDSSWAIYRQNINRAALKYMLGNIDIPAQEITEDHGLNSLISISKASNTLSGYAQKSKSLIDKNDVIVDRMSVMPEDVAHIICGQDEETISGEVIKKGTRFSDIIPNGGTIISTNNGSHILGIYPGIHHSKEMTSGVYHMRLESGAGRGSEDTVEVQKRFLRLDAQNVKYMEATATPAHTYVKGSVDRQHIKKIGHPTAIIPINPEVAQAFGTTEVIRQLAPGSMPAQFFQYTYDILNQYRQLTSHSTDFTNAFPGVDNKTATGAKMAKANADSIYSPFLQLKAEVRRSVAKKTLELYKEHFKGVKQYMPFGETETGQMIGDDIDGDDVDDCIEFAVVRDSEQPKTPLDRQTDMVNMMMVAGQAGGIEQLKATDPKLYETLLRSFDIDIEDNVYSTMVDVCEDRLEQALALGQQYKTFQDTAAQSGVELPQLPIESILLGLTPTIQLEEPIHDQKMKWFMDYLDTPVGYKLSNEDRAVVGLFVRTHAQMFIAQQEAMAAGFATVAQAGAPADPNAQTQPDPEKEAQLSEAQSETQHMRDSEKEAAKFERDKEMKTADQQHEMTKLGLQYAHEDKKFEAEQRMAKEMAQKTAKSATAPQK